MGVYRTLAGREREWIREGKKGRKEREGRKYPHQSESLPC